MWHVIRFVWCFNWSSKPENINLKQWRLSDLIWAYEGDSKSKATPSPPEKLYSVSRYTDTGRMILVHVNFSHSHHDNKGSHRSTSTSFHRQILLTHSSMTLVNIIFQNIRHGNNSSHRADILIHNHWQIYWYTVAWHW